MELQELPANVASIRPLDMKRIFTFTIPHDKLVYLSYRNEPVKLPRWEVQMRMFEVILGAEQPDSFPPSCSVALDDNPVTLPVRLIYFPRFTFDSSHNFYLYI
jgi:hypothetical protein